MPLTRDDFELWLFEMDDRLEAFFREIPREIRDRLDYSPSSLSVLEAWLMAKYANPKAILADSEKGLFERASTYVGETYRKNIRGIWTIDLDNPKNAYFQIPVLRKGNSWEDCPYTLVTASLDRRTGTFMEGILTKKLMS